MQQSNSILTLPTPINRISITQKTWCQIRLNNQMTRAQSPAVVQPIFPKGISIQRKESKVGQRLERPLQTKTPINRISITQKTWCRIRLNNQMTRAESPAVEPKGTNGISLCNSMILALMRNVRCSAVSNKQQEKQTRHRNKMPSNHQTKKQEVEEEEEHQEGEEMQ